MDSYTTQETGSPMNVGRSGKESSNKNWAHREGRVARAIEKQTARMPSDVFLWAAAASMGTSLTLKILGRKHDALFIGQWAAPFLLLGIYNKIVKVAGHDQKTGNVIDSSAGSAFKNTDLGAEQAASV